MRATTLLLLILAGLATALWRFDGSLGILNDDAARYMILGHALAAGQGYRHLNEPDAPLDRKYPPGYPALIAAVTTITAPHRSLADAVPPVKALNLFFLAGVMTLTATLAARKGQAPTVLFCATGVVGLHPSIHKFVGAVMSEIPYLFMSLAAVAVLQRVHERGGTERHGWQRTELLGAGLLLAATMYIRTIGVTLVVSTTVLLLWRGRRREALWLLAIPAVAMLAWTATLSAVPGASPHIPYALQWLVKDPLAPELGSLDLESLVRRPLASVKAYGVFLSEAVTPGLESLMASPARLAAGLLLAATGYLWTVRRRLDLPELYVAAYLAFIVMWPWNFSRLIVPLLPFVVVYFLRGLYDGVALGGRILGPRWSRLAPPIAVLLVTLASVIGVLPVHRAAADDARRPLEDRTLAGGWDGYWRAVRWIQDHPEAASIVTRNPAFMHVYTGRPATTYPDADPERVARFLLRSGATHVVEDGYTFIDRTEKYLRPAIEHLQATNRTTLVHEAGAPPTRIWAITRD